MELEKEFDKNSSNCYNIIATTKKDVFVKYTLFNVVAKQGVFF